MVASRHVTNVAGHITQRMFCGIFFMNSPSKSIFRFLSSRAVFFFAGIVLLCILFSPVLLKLINFSFDSDTFTYIPFIPFLSIYIVYRDMRILPDFRRDFLSVYAAAILIAIALTGYPLFHVYNHHFVLQNYLSATVTCFFLAVTGLWIFIWGIKAFLKTGTGFIILLFMIPMPTLFLEWTSSMLQHASTVTVHFIFSVTGVSFLREGATFHMSQLQFCVARECSGIRSSLALFITAIAAGHLIFSSLAAKSFLLISVLPITIFKNSLRISILTLGSIHIDERILQSQIHRNGGILFFGFALLLLFGMVWLLQKLPGENPRKKQ